MRNFLLMAILSLFALPFCMRTQTNPVDTSTSEGMAALLFLYPFEDVSTGLVAYFPFQGNAKDATGSGHDGTVSGATLTSNHRGIPGAAYFFTKASGHYIQASDTGLQTGAQARTTCLWTNPSSLPIAAGVNTLYAFGTNAGGQMDAGYLGGGPPQSLNYQNIGSAVNLNITLTAGNWYHVCTALDASGNAGIYLNGYHVAGIPLAFNTVSSGTLLIGAQLGLSNFFDGTITEVRLYNRSLTPAQIYYLYSRF